MAETSNVESVKVKKPGHCKEAVSALAKAWTVLVSLSYLVAMLRLLVLNATSAEHGVLEAHEVDGVGLGVGHGRRGRLAPEDDRGTLALLVGARGSAIGSGVGEEGE